MTVTLQIEALRERQRRVWEEGLTSYLQVVACSLGLCGEAQAIEDAVATAPRPEDKQRAQHRLQSLQHARKRAWERIENEVKQLEVAIAVLERAERGEV